MNKLHRLFKKKPYLAWSVKDKREMSKESMVEQIFNYGNWHDYLAVEKNLGVSQVKAVFEKLKRKNRTNLRAKTINYFNKYFAKYA